MAADLPDLDREALGAFLSREIEDFGAVLEINRFSGGSSNPTYLLKTTTGNAERQFVLRKKPPGEILGSAHQVEREFRVMKALEGAIPVPHMHLLCEDRSIIGTSFYVMDYIDGRIFRDARLPDLDPIARTAVYDELNATLAALHRVDIAAVGLSDFGRAEGYFERQISRWTKQYRASETETIPEMDALIEALPARIPADNSVAIAHGDYRLENMIFHPEEPRLLAVLDWELCTIGHPIADLAYNCYLWHSRSVAWGTLDGVDLSASGIPSENDYVARYCKRVGRDHIDDWPFYLAFAIFRLAAITQGVERRLLDGNAARQQKPGMTVRERASQALSMLDRCQSVSTRTA